MKTALPRTVAVVSQVWAGHIPTYHRLYVEAFAEAGCRVIEVLPDSPTPVRRIMRQLDRFAGMRGRRAWRWAEARVTAAERRAGMRAEAVFLVFLDQAFLESAITAADVDNWLPRPWAGVTNEPSAVRGPIAPFSGRERVLAAKHCRAVVVTDDAFVAGCRGAWPGRRVVVMPEVADLSAPVPGPDIAGLHRFAGGRKRVGLVGVISAKKNVAAFVEVARLAWKSDPGLAFFLAGDFSAQACPGPERRLLAQVIAEAPPNCRLFPDPIPDGAAFNAWVKASDVVWVAYRNVYFKSNVLTKAAHFRRPVLVSPGRVMAAHVSQFNLGEVVDVADAPAALAAIRRLAVETAGAGRDFEGFSALNDARRLRTTVHELLDAYFLPQA